jgi:hypothetical protein
VREHARRFRRKVATSLLVVGGHVLVFVVLSRSDSSFVWSEPEEIVRIVLSLSPPPPDRQDESPLDAAGKRTASRDSKRKPRSTIERESDSPESPNQLASERAIDWSAEVQRSAHDAAASDEGPRTRAFGNNPESPYRPCVKRESSFNWNPEPKKAGFAGGLPFVKVKRCIIGLGFFGCEIGAPPPANGALLDDMKSGNRERSSVPDIDECLQASPANQTTPESLPEKSSRRAAQPADR